LTEQEKANNEFDVVSLVKKFNDVDFLIIDDIDLILKKPSIDEKVFHLYNHLMQKGKQLIFSSSIPANQLKFTDQNLKSRLESGLTVKIEKMNDEDKRKVIKKLAKDFEVFIPNNVVDYILSSAPRDFISLYNIVSRINRLSLETKKKITLPLVRNLFKYVFLKV
jgi:DnaA family protein